MADWAEDVCLQSDCWLIDWVGEEGKKKRLSGERKQEQLENWQGKEEDVEKGGRAQEKQGK